VKIDVDTLQQILGCREPTHPAIVSPDDGVVLSYGDLDRTTSAFAGLLATVGVERGDRVAIVLANGPEFLQGLLAVASLGAAAAPLNPAYTRDEFAFYLGDIRPRVLLVPLGAATAAREAAQAETLIAEVVAQAHGAIGLLIDGRDVTTETAFTPVTADDVALLLHTSGTTSRPKQVPLLHRNLVASARSMGAHYKLSSTDVSFCAMPLFHVHGLVGSTLSTLLTGGTVVVPRRLSPRRFDEQARACGVTWFSAGPTFHHMLLEKADSSTASIPSLRFIRSCSSALTPALLERIERRFGVPMLEAYGMTEASHQIASNPLPPAARVAGAVGVPIGAEVRIVSRSGQIAPDGTAGEVQIRGPAVTPGYVGNPEANAEAFVDGWFRTGDLGVLENGYLRLEGRLKEMILRGGENVSPAEIEEILLGHPAVTDAACFGVPDEKYGEEVAAAVSLNSEVTEPELIDYCRERLTTFKVPKQIFVLDAVPRTATGKLQRRRIAAQLTGQRR
jgi:acyl-CoA synthetase (AMP-forming)/AMP-acid ligase II